MSVDISNCIDYTSYFNHPCVLERHNEIDSDYSPDGEFGAPETIMCWVGGAEKFTSNSETGMTVASKTYRTLTPINSKDRIDGQVVIYSYTKFGLDGVTVEFYKAYVE